MPRYLAIAFLCALLAACASAPKDNTDVNLPPAPPPGEPADIAGIGASALRVAFGAPAFVRRDGPAEIWRYDGPGCKAFFFLYSNGTSFTVKHVETVPRGGAMAADTDCLAQIRQRTSGPVS